MKLYRANKATQMSEKADAARFIARILANRQTPLDEVAGVIDGVQRALSGLSAAAKPRLERGEREPEPAAATEHAEKKGKTAKPPRAPAAPRDTRPLRQAAPAKPSEAPVSEPESKAPQPTLLRRAEVIHVAPAAPSAAILAPSNGNLRGVVQWFDNRTGQGTLRLAGLSHDLPVDAATLTAFGIPRLFKGQEIEATVEGGGENAKILSLSLANATPTSPVSGGMVRDRHAKPVVVELKREALSRSAARAEAELLLRPRRMR